MKIPTSTPLTNRQQQGLARRERILETALSLFGSQGFDGTSTKQIAQAASVTEGLIFHYFPTKEDLLAAVLETRHSFIGELREHLLNAEARPAREVLNSLAHGWMSTLRRESAITTVLFSSAMTHPRVGQALEALIQEGVSRLSLYLQARVQAGELRADLPLAHSALSFYSGLMIFFISHRTLPDAQWSRQSSAYIRDLLSLWFDGAVS